MRLKNPMPPKKVVAPQEVKPVVEEKKTKKPKRRSK